MSTEMSGQRQLEIIIELELASQYFERLSAEINREERHPLPGDEWQMARHIQESILLLKWRIESFGNQKSQVVKLALTKRVVGEQAIAQHSLDQISHSNSE